MTVQRVRVTLSAYAYVDTADYPDEDAEVEDGDEQPEMSVEDAIDAYAEQLAEDEEALESFVQHALEGGDFDNIDVVKA